MSNKERTELEGLRALTTQLLSEDVAQLKARYAAAEKKQTLDDAIALLRSVLEDKGASEKEKTKAKELLGLLDADEKKKGAGASAARPLSVEEERVFAHTNPFARRTVSTRAEMVGGAFTMPSRILKHDEAAARVAELEKELGLR